MAKLVERLLAPAALWVRIQTPLKNMKRVANTLARQKKQKKKSKKVKVGSFVLKHVRSVQWREERV
jgi:hypothetical protein